MPATVLDKLHATWPDLELSVCVLDRHKAPLALHRHLTLHRQMDTKLLSSPLLKELAYNVYFAGYHSKLPAPSGWSTLTHALVTGGHVRVLRIEAQPGRHDTVVERSEPKKLMRLDFTPGMRLPFLEELTLHSEDKDRCAFYYSWDTEHCKLFREAIDVSRLRRLDFGSDIPTDLFSTLMGSLPNLKTLRFGIPPHGSVGVANRFIESLPSLESLDIDLTQLAIDKLWPTIMKRKGTLKELILRRPGHRDDIDRLQTLSNQFPMLERLGWEVPCESNVRL